MKGMLTCKVCGRDFALIVEDHYTARDTEKKGVIPALAGSDESKQWDAFDCPHCGCQNVVQERKQPTCPCDFGICDECDHVGDQVEEHDGCTGCAHESVPEGEYPCSECKCNYADLWEKEENDE